ncbi:MAG: NADH-quinone oxidoreductase subunit B [Zestosphaera tikiterensis]|uniref:NADH-quinone oxidoreductase subunit B n=1 Tax=Zestosphaera tikiterensis TaxID=1973259 RepID=A0A2R7Y3P5_9CREN|nr:MAG: NADH-quinone oxidoreductase subunit B [Zestosphaera tikiterensis]
MNEEVTPRETVEARKKFRLSDWFRSKSLWMIHYCSACGAVELPPVFNSPLDLERYGVMPAPSPRQSDVLVIMGYVNKKTLKVLLRMYEQMPEPKYVLVGCNCPATGGLYWDSYATIKRIDEYLPVDLWVPGCMPRDDDWLKGFIELARLIREGKVPQTPRPLERKPGELEELLIKDLEEREKRMLKERG